jgi:hypothetical protein
MSCCPGGSIIRVHVAWDAQYVVGCGWAEEKVHLGLRQSYRLVAIEVKQRHPLCRQPSCTYLHVMYYEAVFSIFG